MKFANGSQHNPWLAAELSIYLLVHGRRATSASQSILCTHCDTCLYLALYCRMVSEGDFHRMIHTLFTLCMLIATGGKSGSTNPRVLMLHGYQCCVRKTGSNVQSWIEPKSVSSQVCVSYNEWSKFQPRHMQHCWPLLVIVNSINCLVVNSVASRPSLCLFIQLCYMWSVTKLTCYLLWPPNARGGDQG